METRAPSVSRICPFDRGNSGFQPASTSPIRARDIPQPLQPRRKWKADIRWSVATLSRASVVVVRAKQGKSPARLIASAQPRRLIFYLQKQHRHIHSVPHFIYRGAVEDIADETVAVRGHGNKI